MLALLTILGLGLLMGTLARRLTPAAQLLLLLLVTGVVLAEFMSWDAGGVGLNPLELVRSLLPDSP